MRGSPGDPLDTTAYFRRGLSEVGFVEGQNVSIEYCWAEGDNSSLSALVADLVRQQVSVIAAPIRISACRHQQVMTPIVGILNSSGGASAAH